MRARDLPLSARLKLATLRRGRLARSITFSLRGGGRGRTEPSDNNIDIRTLTEIFVDRAYRADYSGRPVLDLGAHRGYFGAYALARGAARVVSYEPEATNFELLKTCAESFDGQTWQVEHAAVGASNGEATLHLREESWGHTLVKRDWMKGDATQYVAVHSFERAVSRASTPNGARLLVKMDVEGSEADIVLDAPASAWAPVSELLIEIEPFCRVDAETLLARLADLGLEPAGPPRGNVHHLIKAGK